MNSEFSLFLRSGKLSPCCCSYIWCTKVRGDHLFGGSTVKVPSDTGEVKIWAILLGLDDILPSYRVSIIHFFEVDIIVKPDVDGSCVFEGIDRIGPTKYQVCDTGNESLISPARPAAAKSIILNSTFHGIRSLKYHEYLEIAASWSKLKKSALLKATLKRKDRKASTENY
jgi:hypothetical protein